LFIENYFILKNIFILKDFNLFYWWILRILVIEKNTMIGVIKIKKIEIVTFQYDAEWLILVSDELADNALYIYGTIAHKFLFEIFEN
jgi:hypothetical protein